MNEETKRIISDLEWIFSTLSKGTVIENDDAVIKSIPKAIGILKKQNNNQINDKQRIIHFITKIIPDDFYCGHISLVFNDDGSLFITVENKERESAICTVTDE